MMAYWIWTEMCLSSLFWQGELIVTNVHCIEVTSFTRAALLCQIVELVKRCVWSSHCPRNWTQLLQFFDNINLAPIGTMHSNHLALVYKLFTWNDQITCHWNCDQCQTLQILFDKHRQKKYSQTKQIFPTIIISWQSTPSSMIWHSQPSLYLCCMQLSNTKHYCINYCAASVRTFPRLQFIYRGSQSLQYWET